MIFDVVGFFLIFMVIYLASLLSATASCARIKMFKFILKFKKRIVKNSNMEQT